MNEIVPLFDKVPLKEKEAMLFADLKTCHEKIQEGAADCYGSWKEGELAEWRGLWKKGGALAYELYSSLTARGISVRYSRGCLEHRAHDVGGGPEKPEFHNHIHTIEDLVKFIQCACIHDELGDVTLGFEFTIEIFCAHRSCPSYAMLSRTERGWETHYGDKGADDDKRCTSLLENLWVVNGINCPVGIGDRFEKLWNDAFDGMDQGTLKLKLDDLARWISGAEKAKPKWA